MVGTNPLAQEQFWSNKAECDDAEKKYYQKLYGKVRLWPCLFTTCFKTNNSLLRVLAWHLIFQIVFNTATWLLIWLLCKLITNFSPQNHQFRRLLSIRVMRLNTISTKIYYTLNWTKIIIKVSVSRHLFSTK